MKSIIKYDIAFFLGLLLLFNTYAQDESLKIYQNYDFISGEKIIFEDNFQSDQDGEFPSHWDLKSGQGVVNKMGDKMAFVITDGNYAKVKPYMKTENYLSDSFTVEFDFFSSPNGAGNPILFFKADGKDTRSINFGYRLNTSNFTSDLSEFYPEGHEIDFRNKWHHAALAYRGGQMKCYIDQYRVLVIPHCGFSPESILLGGMASKQNPIVLTNVRIALGGNMNMLNKILNEGKFATHAITFDVNKAVIKPESMGFLNQLVKFLQDNPTLKLEVDGHTDSDGDDASNMKLSQARADAVKMQLITMGIESVRLIAKGYGETKPISDNSTPDGKANNRRVEFIKL